MLNQKHERQIAKRNSSKDRNSGEEQTYGSDLVEGLQHK